MSVIFPSLSFRTPPTCNIRSARTNANEYYQQESPESMFRIWRIIWKMYNGWLKVIMWLKIITLETIVWAWIVVFMWFSGSSLYILILFAWNFDVSEMWNEFITSITVETACLRPVDLSRLLSQIGYSSRWSNVTNSFFRQSTDLSNPNRITQERVNRKPQTSFSAMSEQSHPAGKLERAVHWNFLVTISKFFQRMRMDIYIDRICILSLAFLSRQLLFFQIQILVAHQNLDDLGDVTISVIGHILIIQLNSCRLKICWSVPLKYCWFINRHFYDLRRLNGAVLGKENDLIYTHQKSDEIFFSLIK
jgi:hypothetical protein